MAVRRISLASLLGLAAVLGGPPPVWADGHPLLVDARWLAGRLADSRVRIVDMVTEPEEYRKGHIPGAVYLNVNVDWTEHLRPDGTFKPLAALRTLYVARGITPDKTVVTYCQTQHRASHSYFVLRLLGYPHVVGYDRSWSEWGNREDLPIAR